MNPKKKSLTGGSPSALVSLELDYIAKTAEQSAIVNKLLNYSKPIYTQFTRWLSLAVDIWSRYIKHDMSLVKKRVGWG